MARIAALRAGGSFGQDSTTESKPRSASPNFCEAICEGLSEFPSDSDDFWRFETSTAHHSLIFDRTRHAAPDTDFSPLFAMVFPLFTPLESATGSDSK